MNLLEFITSHLRAGWDENWIRCSQGCLRKSDNFDICQLHDDVKLLSSSSTFNVFYLSALFSG